MSTIDVTMLQRRVAEADLPASARAGQLIITTDTHKLYVGTGSGLVQVGGVVNWDDISGKPSTFTPTLPIGENNVTGLATDLSSLLAAIVSEASRAQSVEGGIENDLTTEATSRASGDITTLASADTYADSVIATEVTNRNAAIAVEATARASGDTTEATARAAGDTTTLASAETYADAAIATEVTNRNAAIAVETARATAAEAGKQASLGFTPENAANKDANSGYAGLDASSKLKATEFPAPSPTTFGGVKSLAAVAHQFLTSIGTDGIPVAGQPAFGDVSGQAALASQVTGVLPVANGGAAAMTTSPDQYLLPCGLAPITSSNDALQPATNGMAFFQFTLERSVTFTKMSAYVDVTSNGNHYYLGLYTLAGAKIIQGTLTMGAAAGVVTASVSQTTLNPGTYYLAWGTDNGVAVLLGCMSPTSKLNTLINGVNIVMAYKSAQISAGLMPNNLPTSSFSQTTAIVPPAVLLTV